MSGIPLNLAFRGKRTYVHGTDIYNEIMRIVAERGGHAADGAVRMTIRRMTGAGLDLVFEGEGGGEGHQSVANFGVRTGGETVGGQLVETDRTVVNRIPYDEVAIRSKAVKSDQSARMTADPGFTPIEVLVSMTLDLLNDLIPPPEGRRWVFTRLDISRPLQDSDKAAFAITLSKALGKTLTRFSVSVGEPLGDIYFSLA